MSKFPEQLSHCLDPLHSYPHPSVRHQWRPSHFAYTVDQQPITSQQIRVEHELERRLRHLSSRMGPEELLETQLIPGIRPVIFNFNPTEPGDYNFEGLGVYNEFPPDRRPLVLNIRVQIGPIGDMSFDEARQENVRGPGHNTIRFGTTETGIINSMFWASTQGNHIFIESTDEKPIMEHDILNEAAVRILAHYSARLLTLRIPEVTGNQDFWEGYANSEGHDVTYKRVQILSKLGLIEDKVDLSKYGETVWVQGIQEALDGSALGESMRSYFDWINGFLLATPSGEGKINWGDDPKRYLVPILGLTKDGYVVATATEELKHMAPKKEKSSVETHENLWMVLYILNKLNGSKEPLNDFLDRNFKALEKGPILLKDIQGKKLPIMIDHIHHWPKEVDEELVEIVEPDLAFAPPIDAPCGSDMGVLATLSALARAKSLKNPEEFRNGKVIMIKLPGHGVIMVSADNDKLTAVIEKTKWKDPDWV